VPIVKPFTVPVLSDGTLFVLLKSEYVPLRPFKIRLPSVIDMGGSFAACVTEPVLVKTTGAFVIVVIIPLPL
jgi:hypothetical protein